MRTGVVLNKAARLIVVALIFLAITNSRAETTPHHHSVELTALVSESTPGITLQWQQASDATGYQISRKILGEAEWKTMATVDAGRTSWIDLTVIPGVAYEYQVIKTTSGGYTGYGYICSAIRRAPVEDRGKMILVVEQSLAAPLAAELARLQQDLVGDGWTVVRKDVPKTMPAPEVKNLIRGVYEQDRAGTKGLFLFGHIAVPYSGKISPDNHENDLGAWPADVYYAEFDGEWTDSVVDHEQYSINGRSNHPGDGFFDQDGPPGPVRLQMGRVDLFNLTCFANKTPSRSELDLARQYLMKDHKFRHGMFDVPRRGMIFDRMHRGLEREPQTCAAWRSFPGFFGRDQIKILGQYEYFPTLQNEAYMWSYVVSGGSFYGSDYIGTSDDWALNNPKVVFASFLGSWFGQWDRESDFLRAPLGSGGYTLATIFSGQPQWILHPMSMGEPIGHAAMLTQNNSTNGIYPPQINAGFGQVHIALMGDPSLRMHIVKPPGAVTGNAAGSGVQLSWAASADGQTAGYYVYKANSAQGPFTRISGGDPITTTTFTDAQGGEDAVYMVRAMKLEQTPAGSYYNLSQGVFYPDPLGSSAVPVAPRALAGSIVQGAVNLTWISPSVNVLRFEIQRRTLPGGAFEKVGEVAGSDSAFTDGNLSAGLYAYRVKALGFAGESEFSGEATLNVQPAWGNIIGDDASTGGNWIGKYGQDGYVIIGAATNVPSYATLEPRNAYFYKDSRDTTADEETLLRPDGSTRLFAAWGNNHHTPLVLNFRFTDSAVRRVSIYLCDYKSGVRSGTVELVDPFTGRVFSSSYFTNVSKGKYITMDIRNYADVRITSEYEFRYNVWVSGIFFSTAPVITNPETSVDYVGGDATTQGDWQSKYGSNGKMVANWVKALPSEVEIQTGAETWTWSEATTDRRAINKYASDNTRIASAWYGPNEIKFDVSIGSATQRQMVLYFVDWDRSGRVQDLDITDPEGNLVAQERLENFGDGRYVILKAKGKFRISLRRLNGPNAVLNGIFLDTIDAPTPAPPILESSKFDIAASSYTMRIKGQIGQRFKVQYSVDLRSWLEVDQVTLSSAAQDYFIPYRSDLPMGFYRIVVQP